MNEMRVRFKPIISSITKRILHRYSFSTAELLIRLYLPY